MPILNTQHYRAKALLQCALYFYQTTIKLILFLLHLAYFAVCYIEQFIVVLCGGKYAVEVFAAEKPRVWPLFGNFLRRVSALFPPKVPPCPDRTMNVLCRM